MPFTNAVLFTTALCQLSCGYCYICKDAAGGLKQIDDEIADAISSGEFLESTYKATGSELRQLTLWGGEPLLHLDRFTEHLQEWFDKFPKLNQFFMSTNFASSGAIDQLKNFFDTIDKYGPLERYKIAIQLSIDGYEEMNDFGRGKGTTQKFLTNYYRLLELSYNRNKIELKVQLKPTLARDTFQFLDSVDKCDLWFQWLDDKLWLPYRKIKPFTFSLSVFNQAMPTKWTPEDGKEFAKIYQNIVDVDAWRYDGWKHYKVPLLAAAVLSDTDYSQPTCGPNCGAFYRTVVPIPGGRYTICHRGLFDGYIDYCNNIQQKEEMNGLAKGFLGDNGGKHIMTLEQLQRMERTIGGLTECPARVLYSDNMNFINYYARAGIIDERWKNPEEVEKTLGYWISRGYCLQDAYSQNASWTTLATLEYPLLYNGAMDIALRENERVRKAT